jgi:hypothetical protein
MTEHDARVRGANPHDIRFPRRNRRGQVTGYDISHHSGGYQAYCRTCDWTGTVEGSPVEANADAAGHRQKVN